MNIENQETDLEVTEKAKSSIGKKLRLGLLVLVAVAVVGCILYVSDYYHSDVPDRYYADTENVQVYVHETDDEVNKEFMSFVPAEPIAGLIFYPGAKVEYDAYAPLMYELAERGILCVLMKMPCNIAILGKNMADGIKDMYPEVEDWYMGGHSLGGLTAADYVVNHTDEYEGLIILAAYSMVNLTDTDLKVLVMYGSEDTVLNMESYQNNFRKLPSDTVEYVIEGGCHAYFGYYGEQKGDGEPGISREDQIAITVEYIESLINE